MYDFAQENLRHNIENQINDELEYGLVSKSECMGKLYACHMKNNSYEFLSTINPSNINEVIDNSFSNNSELVEELKINNLEYSLFLKGFTNYTSEFCSHFKSYIELKREFFSEVAKKNNKY